MGSCLFQPRARTLALVIGWRKVEGGKPLAEILYSGDQIRDAAQAYEGAGTEFAEVRLYRDPRHHSRRVPTGEKSVRSQFQVQHAKRLERERAELKQLPKSIITARPAGPSLQDILADRFSDAAQARPASLDRLKLAPVAPVESALIESEQDPEDPEPEADEDAEAPSPFGELYEPEPEEPEPAEPAEKTIILKNRKNSK